MQGIQVFLLRINNIGFRYKDLPKPKMNTVDRWISVVGLALLLCLPVRAQSSAVPVIQGSATLSGQVGSSFSYSLIASNGATSFSFVSGTLPPGLTFYPNLGQIGGSPTQTGTFVVTLGATNAFGTGTTAFTITINNPSVATPVINSSSTINGEVGFPVEYSILATNGVTSFSLVSGTFPPGVFMVQGSIQGVPTQAGTFTVTVGASNAAGTGTAPLTFIIGSANTLSLIPVITSPTSVTGNVGIGFDYPITSTDPSFTGLTGYSLVSGSLPPGLAFNSLLDEIDGTPTQTGVWVVTVGNSNKYGTGTAAVTITITPAPVITPVINSSTTVNGAVGSGLVYAITATNGVTSFSIVGGTLPPGIFIVQGTIQGAPTQAGTSRSRSEPAMPPAPGLHRSPS